MVKHLFHILLDIGVDLLCWKQINSLNYLIERKKISDFKENLREEWIYIASSVFFFDDEVFINYFIKILFS